LDNEFQLRGEPADRFSGLGTNQNKHNRSDKHGDRARQATGASGLENAGREGSLLKDLNSSQNPMIARQKIARFSLMSIQRTAMSAKSVNGIERRIYLEG
jgi:hypothetical protein